MTTIRNLLGLFSLVSLGALAGCAGNAGDSNAASNDEADSISSTSTYFIVTHVDARRCVSPICGGVFVKRVNFATTKCADGVYRSECHALTTDYSALGLDESESSKIDATFAEGHVLVRGSLKTKTVHGLAADTLVATEAWVGNALSTPTGTFYDVRDNGRECFTAPCDNVHEAKLDSSTQREVAGVDLTTAGANSKQVAAAEAALANGIIIVAGENQPVSGPGGHSLQLVSSEFYTRVVHTPAAY